MRLTSHILDQVSWWEHTVDRRWGFDYNTPYDRFTLHFKAWWRPAKVLCMDWRCCGIESTIKTFERDDGAKQLLDQLDAYLSYPGTPSP